MNYRYLFFLLTITLFCMCRGYDALADVPTGETEGINLEGYQKVSLRSEITSLQPMTGIVFWPEKAATKNATYNTSIGLEFSYCLPSDVVTGKKDGKINYDWSSFESLLNDIAGRGHQAIIRFRYEYPNAITNGVKGATAVPAYIKALPDYNETYNADAGGDGPTYYANWSNSELQWFTLQFYTDFAAKYDDDPRIAFVQAGFGHWSEYHIYGTILKLGVNFPSQTYQTEFLQHLNSVFKNIPWSISIDAADNTYTPIVKTASLMNLNFGLFDDSFMWKEHEISDGVGYNEACWIAVGKDRWKKAPAGGEISYYTNSDQKNFLNPAGMYGVTWEKASAKYHMSYVLGNDATNGTYATPERMKVAGMACGYHFRIVDFRIKGDSSAVKITNTGIAPLYRDAYVAVNGVRSDRSLKLLLPSDTIWVKIPSGGDKNPVPTIECDYLVAGQKIGYEANIK